jgi:hypothetical protein
MGTFLELLRNFFEWLFSFFRGTPAAMQKRFRAKWLSGSREATR